MAGTRLVTQTAFVVSAIVMLLSLIIHPIKIVLFENSVLNDLKSIRGKESIESYIKEMVYTENCTQRSPLGFNRLFHDTYKHLSQSDIFVRPKLHIRIQMVYGTDDSISTDNHRHFFSTVVNLLESYLNDVGAVLDVSIHQHLIHNLNFSSRDLNQNLINDKFISDKESVDNLYGHFSFFFESSRFLDRFDCNHCFNIRLVLYKPVGTMYLSRSQYLRNVSTAMIRGKNFGILILNSYDVTKAEMYARIFFLQCKYLLGISWNKDNVAVNMTNQKHQAATADYDEKCDDNLTNKIDIAESQHVNYYHLTDKQKLLFKNGDLLALHVLLISKLFCTICESLNRVVALAQHSSSGDSPGFRLTPEFSQLYKAIYRSVILTENEFLNLTMHIRERWNYRKCLSIADYCLYFHERMEELSRFRIVLSETYQKVALLEDHPGFNRENYFSLEYKVVLYAPYWIPITLPLIWGLVAEIKRYRLRV